MATPQIPVIEVDDDDTQPEHLFANPQMRPPITVARPFLGDSPMVVAAGSALEDAAPRNDMCQRCSDNGAVLWLKLTALAGPVDSAICSGQQLCQRCASVYLMDINFLWESTGIAQDCKVLHKSQPLAEGPEGAHPPLSRSHSFMVDEHMCELCANYLVHYSISRKVQAPCSDEPDSVDTLELCPICSASVLCKLPGDKIIDFIEIIHNEKAD